MAITKSEIQSILSSVQTQNTEKILALVDKYQLTPEKLEAICNAPALTEDNVQQYLNGCSQQKLAEIFYTTGLVKLAQTVELRTKEQEALKAKENQNAPIPNSTEAGSSAPVPNDGESTGRS